MPMSNDRIEFLLTCNSNEIDATTRAAVRAFGITFSEVRLAPGRGVEW